MPKAVTLKNAREKAFRGEVEAALAAFRTLGAGGEYRAVASLAGLYAFRGELDECLASVRNFIENGPPDDLHTGLRDMVRLLGWLGRELGLWEDIARIGANGLANLKAKCAVLWSDSNIQFAQNPSAYPRSLAEQKALVLEGLIAYAHRRGEPPHELLAIFGGPQPVVTPEEQRHRYEYALTNMYSLCPDLCGKPEAAAQHRYSLAKGYLQEDEAIRELFAHPEPMRYFMFQDALYVVQVIARRGEFERAWELIRRWLPQWYPEGGMTQVAPIELLIDPELAPIMTPARCEEVLSCPRAGETPEEREARAQRKRERAQAKRRPAVPVLRITSFTRTEVPVEPPVTKFGGQPVWIDKPQWPIGRTLNRPMQFVCQIELRARVFGGESGRMAYLFVDEGDIEHPTGFWDAGCGDNAVIIQPGGLISVPVIEVATGPTLDWSSSCEYLPNIKVAKDPPIAHSLDTSEVSEAESDRLIEQMSGNKIGGTPLFYSNIEYPNDSSEWRLLLQLDEDVPFQLNLCMGMGYAFISQDGKRAAYFCQSG